MAEHVTRWLSCDFPGCTATFEPAHYRDVLARGGGLRTFRHIRDGAAIVGWMRTSDGDDLCKRHADRHRGRPAQPTLFPVPRGDHAV